MRRHFGEGVLRHRESILGGSCTALKAKMGYIYHQESQDESDDEYDSRDKIDRDIYGSPR